MLVGSFGMALLWLPLVSGSVGTDYVHLQLPIKKWIPDHIKIIHWKYFWEVKVTDWLTEGFIDVFLWVSVNSKCLCFLRALNSRFKVLGKKNLLFVYFVGGPYYAILLKVKETLLTVSTVPYLQGKPKSCKRKLGALSAREKSVTKLSSRKLERKHEWAVSNRGNHRKRVSPWQKTRNCLMIFFCYTLYLF